MDSSTTWRINSVPSALVWCGVVWCGVVWCCVVWCAVPRVVQHGVLWVEMCMTHLLPVQSQQKHWVTANILQSVHPIYKQNVAHRVLQPLNKSRNL